MRRIETGTAGLGRRLRGRELPPWLEVWVRMVRERPLATAGLVIVLLLFINGLFAEFIAPEGYHEPHLERLQLVEQVGGTSTVKFVGPSLAHPMGLDHQGRDILSRVIYGARVSLVVGFGTAILATLVATVIGMASAWFGGVVDTLIQRVVDGMMVFPWLVLVLVIVTILPNKPPWEFMNPTAWGVIKVIIALSFLEVAWLSRVVRSAALSTKQNQYVEAAMAIGASFWRINLQYILPNIMAPIITVATLEVGYAILSEAFLSFLGHGVPPPYPSWGGMLNVQARNYIYRAPWMAFFPGLMITLVVFGINVLGDGLRDLLDPRLRGTKTVGRYTG